MVYASLTELNTELRFPIIHKQEAILNATTLCSMLSSCVNDQQNDWDTKLPFMLFTYRTAQHETTNKTPFFLVYCREARLDFPIQSNPEIDNFEGVLKQRCDALIKFSCEREEASNNIKQAQKKQKKHYYKKIKNKILQIGDEVLLHNSRKLSRKGGTRKVMEWSLHNEAIHKKGTYTL